MTNENKVYVLERDNFHILLELLSHHGYELYGPTVDDENLVYDKIMTEEDLPIGWVDVQKPGSYRLERSNDNLLFGFTVGSQTWKKILYPSEQKLWEISGDGDKFSIAVPEENNTKRALIGVRSCELHALSILDKVLTEGPHPEPNYISRRKNVFIVAVNCTRPSGTCFCTSMKTGPKAESGFDLSVMEIAEWDEHYFLLESGSESGEKVLNELPTRDASSTEIEAGEEVMKQATLKMGRQLNTDNLQNLLYDNFDNPYWDEIAERCLSCGNCTMVCPTCFCADIEDSTALDGHWADRKSRWDSCFMTAHSYIHGGSIRASTKSRYRQWMMHKLSYWPEQFGTFGCVGCGRCITWCPAGIDITEEAAQFRKKSELKI